MLRAILFCLILNLVLLAEIILGRALHRLLFSRLVSASGYARLQPDYRSMATRALAKLARKSMLCMSGQARPELVSCGQTLRARFLLREESSHARLGLSVPEASVQPALSRDRQTHTMVQKVSCLRTANEA